MPNFISKNRVNPWQIVEQPGGFKRIVRGAVTLAPHPHIGEAEKIARILNRLERKIVDLENQIREERIRS